MKNDCYVDELLEMVLDKFVLANNRSRPVSFWLEKFILVLILIA